MNVIDQLRRALDQHPGGEEKVAHRAMDKLPELHGMVLEGIEVVT